MNILCVLDFKKHKAENLVSAASKIPGNNKISLFSFENLPPETIENLKSSGADQLFLSNSEAIFFIPSVFADNLTKLIKNENPDIVLFCASKEMKSVAAIAAAKLNIGLNSDAIDIEWNESEKKALAIKPTCSSNILVKIISRSTPQMISIKSDFFEPSPKKNTNPEIINFDFNNKTEDKITLISSEAVKKTTSGLKNAQLIIAAGRGIKNKEEFGMVEQLAELLGGAVGITRPLLDMKEDGEECQIGLTGKTINPALYIAIGISGKIQHTQSISRSKCIISINNDINAPIKKMSDYFIEEDIKEFLPAIIKKIKETKGIE